MAWFETSLDRLKMEKAELAFHAAWHLSFLNNITQFGLSPNKKFQLRHGITHEKDALMIKIQGDKNDKSTDDGNVSLDIIGRAVVMAFRLSGIQATFPSIVTQKDIATSAIVNFKKWNPTAEDRLKYFKGEKLGTNSVYVSGERKITRIPRLSTVAKKITKMVAQSEQSLPRKDEDDVILQALLKFIHLMSGGPDWCKLVIDAEVRHIKESVEVLKSAASYFETLPDRY